MSISVPDRKKLWGKSGGFCAMCKIRLIESEAGDIDESDDFLIGEEAHIRGEKETSARYDPEMTDLERNSEKNLLLLCPTDHTRIDKDASSYPVADLLNVKRDHEKWVHDSIQEQMPNVTYAELEVTVDYLIQNVTSRGEESISFVNPSQKISINGISPLVQNLITVGMARVNDVKEYLNSNPDINFGEKLKSGLVLKYNELRNQELDSDTIFLELVKFSSCNSRDSVRLAASLAVVVYFFEACDIFEK